MSKTSRSRAESDARDPCSSVAAGRFSRAWECYVDQRDFGVRLFEKGERGPGIHRFRDHAGVPRRLEDGANAIPEQRVIVDDRDSKRRLLA